MLHRVEMERADADDAVGAILARHPGADARDRALLNELVMGTLRMRGAIDREIARASTRAIHEIDPRALSAIRVAAYQVLFLDRVPAHAAVNAAVEDVKSRPRGEGAAKFVNAVLRSVIRGKPEGRKDLSHPDWLVKLFEKTLGVEGVAAFCAANNAPPPFTIRATGAHANRDALAGLLEAEGVKAASCRFAPQGLTLDRGVHPPASPSFRKGLWTVQDEAAQLVSLALDPHPGMKVLDACAAPGGKTAHIADLMGGSGEVLAIDRSEDRLALVRETVKRLGLSSVRIKVHDAAVPLPEAPLFDRILVDAPCTGLGTLRRSPEIKWRIKSGDPRTLARQQLAILVNLAKYLKADGVMVYSVCTVTDEEGPGVAAQFLSRAGGFSAAPPEDAAAFDASMRDGAYIRTWPHLHGTDGFFIARFVKAGRTG